MLKAPSPCTILAPRRDILPLHEPFEGTKEFRESAQPSKYRHHNNELPKTAQQ